MRHEQKPTYSFLILTAGLIVFTTILAGFVAFKTPLYPAGISTFYPAIVFMILFALYFGGYGVIAAYAGGFLGAGILAGISPEVAVFWALADLFEVLIPLVAVRYLSIDPGLRTRRDLLLMVLFAVILNNIVGAAWGAVMLAIAGVIGWSAIPSFFLSWLLGNVILTALLLLPALYFLTPVVAKSKLFVRHYWN